MNGSLSDSAGTSNGNPPACQTPRLTSSARSRRCVWHGLISLHVFTTAITGSLVVRAVEAHLQGPRAVAEGPEVFDAEPAVAAQHGDDVGMAASLPAPMDDAELKRRL